MMASSMTSSSTPQGGARPVPVPRPRAPTLAFVPYRHTHWWWPAIVYSSYGEAMEERYDTMSWKARNLLLWKMYEQHRVNRTRFLEGSLDQHTSSSNTTMCVAQLLGYQDLWVEFDSTQQKHMLTYVMEALAQREKLPSEIQNVYDLAFEQLKLLLTYDDPSCTNSSVTAVTDGSSTIIKSLDDILSMGTKLYPDGATTTQMTTTMTTTMTTMQTTMMTTTTTKTTDANRNVEHQPHPRKRRKKRMSRLTASQRAQRSRDNFYVFRVLWPRLKEDGWTLVRAGNPLYDWYYIPPATKDGTHNDTNDAVKNGVMGVDYFTSTDHVIEWARRTNYRSSVGVTTSSDDSS